MPDVLIKDVPEDLLERLRARAAAAGRTLDSELRDMTGCAEAKAPERKRRLFDAFDRDHPPVRFDADPAELIRQERDRPR